jgi:AraC-like DNA-binding protein/mannose-6-phosphate isomerase-like protein (cupin superfamily)
MMSEIGMLKSYRNAQITKDHGVRCDVHKPSEFPLHHHDYYELEIVAEGEMFHECNGRGMMLRRGDVYILSPNDVHRLVPSQKTTIYNLCIYTEQCSKSIARLLLDEEYPRFGRVDDSVMEEISALHSALRDVLNSTGQYRGARTSALTTLLVSRLFEMSDAEISLQTDQSYSTIAKAMSFIEAHLANPITLEEVAAASGYSRTYFSRLFKEIVGINFKYYLERERIELASDLLEIEEMSITEIAYAVGFNSFSSFWRSFKKLKGVSPREWRNR